MIVTMAKTGTFPVKQGIDPRYLQSILTKDVTVLEGIYDLIDNSIDAARDRLLGLKKSRTDEYEHHEHFVPPSGNHAGRLCG